MKHKGSITETYIHRDNVVLPALFRKAKEMASYPTTMKELCQIVASLPVPCFCISDDAALNYMRCRILKGRIKHFKSDYKNRLFEALYQTVRALMKVQSSKFKVQSIKSYTLQALDRPAPCVGLTPDEIQRKLHDMHQRNKHSRLHGYPNSKI